MKLNTRKHAWMPSLVAGLALAASSTAVYGASDIDFGPTGTEASTANSDGTWINMWGPAYVSTTFDTANPPPTGDTQGSIYNQGNWTGDTGGMDDYNMISPGTWWGNVKFDPAQYTSIEMDFKYDTNSTMSPAGNAQLGIGFDTGYDFNQVTNLVFTSGTGIADGNWHHLSLPFSAASVGSIGDNADGISYYRWNPGGTTGTMNYWMANVRLVAQIVAVPPPTMNPPQRPAAGLNVFASTEASLYDRQEAELVQNSGLSWVGQATTANPVSYAFTISSYPNSINCEAYLFLVPNPAGNDNAPDWNETNVVIGYLQGSPSNAIFHFEYKVNEDHQQAMYSGGTETRGAYTNAPGSWDGTTTNYLESGDLGSVTNDGVLGTWTIMFTSDTNVTLIAPDGSKSSFVFPAYNVGYFAETASPGFNIYLGMQANNADAINQAVDYTWFNVSNTASPYSENFLGETALSTSIWTTAQASGPKGVLIVPATAADWVYWSLPYSGFSLETGSSLTSLGTWTSPSLYTPVPFYGYEGQLVDSTELPAGNSVFFNMVKRVPTQLQVLLAGETNAPGTATGKVGTPTAVSLSGSASTTVTVNEVDSTFHIVSSSDTVTLTTSDSNGGFLPSGPYTLVNGTVTATALFGTEGSQTVTASDTTSTNITSNTSSPVSVGP